MSEVVKLLKEIKEKLEEMDKRLRKIEDELFDELSEEELKEVEEILKACKTGKMKTYTLEELKKELEI
jgi:DNA-binding MarR family transcriptional regulator